MSGRQAARARGDMRAMEVEHNRSNPMGEGPSLAGQLELSGGGATPSMGLSQYRGGSMERMVGSGTHKGQMRKTARRAYMDEDEDDVGESVGSGRHRLTTQHMPGRMSEAMEMGLHLGKHLHHLHGGGFFDDFVKGIGSAVSTIAPIASTAMKFAPMLGLGHDETTESTGSGRRRKAMPKHKRRIRNGRLVGGESNSTTGAYDGEGRERDDVRMTGVEHGSGLLGQDGHGVRGGGFLSDLGIPGISQLAGMIGLGHDETTESTGTGRKRRAKRPVGEHDGRRKRAEVVRKVMREKGMKMIEASKYVKAHGLY